MSRGIIFDQWRDRTEEPVIVLVYDGVWELQPVAVDDTHEGDLQQEYASAFYAARAYRTFDEVCEEWSDDLTPEQVEGLYSRGDYSAERRGLPAEWYVEGTEEGGGDTVIYIDDETLAGSHRATLEDEVPYLDPEDVARIYRAIIEAREEWQA